MLHALYVSAFNCGIVNKRFSVKPHPSSRKFACAFSISVRCAMPPSPLSGRAREVVFCREVCCEMFFCETYEMFAVNKHFCDEPIYKSEPDLPSPKAGRGDRTPRGVWWVRHETLRFPQRFAHGVRRAQKAAGSRGKCRAKTKRCFVFEPCVARFIPPPRARSVAARKRAESAQGNI